MLKKILQHLGVYSLVIIVFLNLYFYFLQPSLFFYPLDELQQTPSDWGMEYQDVDLIVNQSKIHGWYISAKKNAAVKTKTLLFFHGNGGNISHRSESIYIFHRLGLNILIIDYPGYGYSEGSPSETGLYQSAQAAWNYLVEEKKTSPESIIIFGRSLGGAVAADLASKVKAGALILESTFSSARDVAEVAFPFLANIIYLRYSFDSISKLNDLSTPVVVIHSPDDEVIPFETGKKLFDSLSPGKQSLIIRGGHNNGFMQSVDSYVPFLRDFINSI